MLRIKRTSFALAAVAMVATQTAQEQLSRIELRLAAERPGYTYIAAEPVVVNLTLINRGDARREIPLELEPDYEAVFFHTRLAGSGEWRQFRPWALFENDANQTLAPNAAVLVPSRIFFGADGWTFPSTGTYEIFASFGAERSNTLRIQVVSALTDEERSLSGRLLENREASKFLLLDGGDHLLDGLPLVLELAASSTRFSGYAANALGLSASEPYINLRTGQAREANLDEAMRLLQQSRLQLPEGHFRLENFRVLSRTLRLMGREPEVVELERRYRFELNRADLEPAYRAHALRIIPR